MPPIVYVLAFIIIGFIFAVLFGMAARLGAGQEVEPPPIERETAANHYEGRM